MSYSQLLQDSDFHQTTTSDQGWTTHYSPETNTTPHAHGVLRLMDYNCAPPPYHTVVTLSQSVDDQCVNSSTGGISESSCFNSEEPPPYSSLS